MENRANYALIGAVILFAAVALLGVIIWMGQVQFNREYEEYDVVFDGPVNGLSEGAAVRYLGLKVGEVEELRIDPGNDSRVIARIRVDSETPVRVDSTAILDFVGLTGATFIQIQAGSQNSDHLKRIPGGGVPVIPTEPTQLANLVTGGQQIMAEANQTLTRLNRVMSDENVAALSLTLENAALLSEKLAGDEGLVEELRGTIARVDRAVASLETAANSINELAQSSNTEVVRLGENMDATLAELRTSTEQLRAALVTATEEFSSTLNAIEDPAVDLLSDFRLIGQDAQLLIRRLDGLAREFEQNPRGLVLGERLPTSE